MNAITLSNQNLPLVEYKGQRVVTFAMVDQAHRRPNITASDEETELQLELMTIAESIAATTSECCK